MKVEIEDARRFARALVRDIEESPSLRMEIDHLVDQLPEHAGKFITFIRSELAKEVTGNLEDIQLPRTRMLFHQAIKEEAIVREGSGLGQFFTALISTALPAITKAASSIYVAKLNLKSQKKILKLQLAAQQRESATALAQAEAIKAQAEAKKMEALAAMKAAERKIIPPPPPAPRPIIISPPPAVPGAPPMTLRPQIIQVPGQPPQLVQVPVPAVAPPARFALPSWALPVGIGAAALILILFLIGKKKGS